MQLGHLPAHLHVVARGDLWRCAGALVRAELASLTQVREAEFSAQRQDSRFKLAMDLLKLKIEQPHDRSASGMTAQSPQKNDAAEPRIPFA